VVYAVTNGKIVLSDREELAREWRDETARVRIQGPEDVKDARQVVEEHARAAGMSEDRIHDLCVCASEATTNALKHAGGGELGISVGGGQFRIRVTDHGAGIDTWQLPRATLMRGYSTRSSMGLGFTLMHEMADRLLLSTDREGTTLILEMALQPESEVDRALALLKAVEF
jgi:anti-sigma regulatory factor (Ser/Thr protein kinase)